MIKVFVSIIITVLSLNASAAIKESWTCYRNGSEFLKMEFDGKTYSATLQGVLDKVTLKGEGKRPSELTGLEEPFYDTVNYTIKINRSGINDSGLDREVISKKIGLYRHGYWDCYGRFSDSESLECTVEIERD